MALPPAASSSRTTVEGGERNPSSLSLPFAVESYGPGDSEYAASQRLLQRNVGGWGGALPTMWWPTASTRRPRFPIAQATLGLYVVARLEANLPELYAHAQARHTPHHHARSLEIYWLLLVLALSLERLWRLRYLHRGTTVPGLNRQLPRRRL